MDTLRHIAPLAIRPADRWEFAGTAFCFRAPEYLITAAHCVAEMTPDRVGYANPEGRIIQALSVEKHPSADVAVLRVSTDGAFLSPFWDFVGNYGLGEEFWTYGFPYEDLKSGLKQLLPRLFHGYFQRIFDYSHGPWRYAAAEINTPAPLGLSGAPLFRPGAPQMLTGVVTANFSSELVEDYYEEVHDRSGKTVHRTARITTYGVAVLLSPIRDWLNAHLPPWDGAKHAASWHD